MRNKVFGGLLILGLLAVHSSAAILQFTSRPTWTAAVGGPIQTETFNGFAVDASFQGGPVSILNGSIVEVNGPPANGAAINKIDVSPFNFAGLDFDGSPCANLDVGGNNDTSVQIDFTSPVSAWGADFFGLNWVGVVNYTVLDLFDSNLAPIGTVPPLQASTDFFGFQLDAGEQASRIVFRFVGNPGANDGFALDNASFVAQPVPEPSTGALAGLGIAAFLWLRRRARS